MNSKKVALLGAAGFIFVFVFDWVYHGMLLKHTYEQTAMLWRSPEAMQMMMPFGLLSQLIFAITAAIFFYFGYEGKGDQEGFRYGFYLGTLLVGLQLACFTYMPIPSNLLIAWIGGDYLKAFGLGFIFVRMHDKVKR